MRINIKNRIAMITARIVRRFVVFIAPIAFESSNTGLSYDVDDDVDVIGVFISNLTSWNV